MSLLKRPLLVLFFVGLIVSASVCVMTASAKEPAKKAAKGKTAKTKKVDEAKLFKVKDGTPEKLSKQLQKVMAYRKRVKTYKEYREYMQKKSVAMYKLANKILDSDDATKKQQNIAAVAKYRSISVLISMKSRKARKALDKLPQEFRDLGLDKLAESADSLLLREQFSEAIDGKPDAKSVEEMLDLIKEKVKGKTDRASYGMMIMAISSFEKKKSKKEAIALCKDFVKLYAGDKSKEAKKIVKKIEGVARGMQLMGNTMDISGTLVDGEALDWDAYKGKVVLVQFWATWCAPCRAEIPNVLKQYKKYHDLGFDVVSISLDTKPEKLEEFLEKNKLPWVVVFETDKEDQGWDAPMAIKYGISGIPALYLLDKDGKVVSDNARGAILDKELKKLLGPVDDPKADDEEEEDPLD